MGEQNRAAKRLRARGELKHANGYDHVESRMGDPLGRAGLVGRRGVVGVSRVARAPRRQEARAHPHHQVRPALDLTAAPAASRVLSDRMESPAASIVIPAKVNAGLLAFIKG